MRKVRKKGIDLVSPLIYALPDGDTKTQFISAARRFTSFTGEKKTYSRQDVLAYFRELEKRGYRSTYLRFTYYALKRAFEEAGIPWDLRPRRDLPALIEEQVQRPTYTKEEVLTMIHGSIGTCDRRELAMLALSTTYGLRRAELAQISAEDLDMDAGTVRIRTKKHGHVRTHIIPDQVRPWVEDYEFIPLTPRRLSQIFTGICRKTGVAEGPRYGFHSIRRCLDSELLYGVTPPEEYRSAWVIYCYDFMRWRYRRQVEFGMHAIYGRITPEAVDRAIFSVHPFLPAWNIRGG